MRGLLLAFFINTVFAQTVFLRPVELITPQNFGLMAKVIYAEYERKGVSCDWHHKLYEESFNVVSPGRDVVESKEILSRALKGERALVEVSSDYTIVSGEEVVAACLLTGEDVRCEVVADEARGCGQQFLEEGGLGSDFLDAMALKYCQLNDKCLLSTVWPRGFKSLEKIKRIWSEYGKVVYEKSFTVKGHGCGYMLRNAPFGNKRKRWQAVLPEYFPKRLGPKFQVAVLLLEKRDAGDSVGVVKKQKAQIRSSLEENFYSIHIDDFHCDSIKGARTFFSDNGIFYMNHFKPATFGNFERLFKIYSEMALKSSDSDDFCIDNGSVLAIYGLRDVGDLDFLHKGHGGYIRAFPGKRKVESHNWIFNNKIFTKMTRDDVIYNPNYHFYYKNLKFASLDVVRSLKSGRPGKKNANDVVLIDGMVK